MIATKAARMGIAFAISLVSVNARAAEIPALPLVWVDVAGAGSTFADAAMTEAAVMLETAGLPVRWIRSDGSQRVAEPDEMQVVLLAAPPPGLGTRIMGGVQPGTPDASTIWVFLSGLRAAVQCRPDDDGRAGACAQELGRAAGRVVVHEIVHLLAPDLPHAHDGLMAPQLGRRALLEPLTVDGVSRNVLHTFAAHRARSAQDVRYVPPDSPTPSTDPITGSRISRAHPAPRGPSRARRTPPPADVSSR